VVGLHFEDVVAIVEASNPVVTEFHGLVTSSKTSDPKVGVSSDGASVSSAFGVVAGVAGDVWELGMESIKEVPFHASATSMSSSSSCVNTSNNSKNNQK
jgi:hypothetical protein